MRRFSSTGIETHVHDNQPDDSPFADVHNTIPRPSLEQPRRSGTHSVSEHNEEEVEEEVPAVNLMTSSNPPRNKWRIISSIMFNFTSGFSDAAPGALLPHIEAYYSINYAVTSCIWVSNAVGFILIATMSHKIQPWFGKRNSLPIGNFLSCVMYGIVASGTKFPVIVVGFFFGGCGLALVAAQCNIFLSRLDKQSKYLAYYHGGYGIGATISPLIATGMVNNGATWNYFYLILLGMMALTGVCLYFSFQNADEDLKPWDHDHVQDAEVELETLNPSGQAPTTNNAQVNSQASEMILALKNPATWLIAFFCLCYQGAEVSLAGWIVTFLLDYRHSNPNNTGYVASGLWAGLTLGRLLLTQPIHKYVGLRRGVFIVSLTSIVLVVLTWVIPAIIAEAVFVSIAGVFIGPNYPLLITFAALPGLIPRKIQVVSITIMTAFGSTGGALFPFIVGVLLQKVGTFVVLPVFIVLYSIMVFLWMLLPNNERQSKQNTMQLGFWERMW
ncbi:Bypass of stop codon protein 6 [Candida viswanathii]|uniref:Bypass of stop codon protein 6 n=1 Tax=Candida viswanathii TaxID=5486 RepID=A0A367XLE2_9ASCO|nr:Bypass of stop codon protein 6 [Candida viswanathii]